MVLGDGLLDPSEWHRDGRGRTWSFSLPTESIIGSLHAVADALDDEFDLIACVRSVDRGNSLSTFSVQPCAALEFGGRQQYFIRSRRITPGLPEAAPLHGTGWPAVLAVNGLIILDHPFASKRDPSASNLGIVHRVRAAGTEQPQVHQEYDRLFSALKRGLGSTAARPG